MSHNPTGLRPGSVQSGGFIQQVGPGPLVTSPGPTVEPPDPVVIDPVTELIVGTDPPGYSVVSKTHLVNMALVNIGVTNFITNLETESSPQAIAARMIFDDERRYVLRDFPWPFARAYMSLGLVAGTSLVRANYDWAYAYRYPSDCVFARRIVWPLGRSQTSVLPFAIGRDADGRLIYTDTENAELEYTAEVTDPSEFDASFVQMFVWRMASKLAIPLSKIPNVAVLANQMYELEKSKAHRAALNEGQQDEPLESEFIRSRG